MHLFGRTERSGAVGWWGASGMLQVVMDCTKHNAADRPTASVLLDRLRTLNQYEYARPRPRPTPCSPHTPRAAPSTIACV